MEEIFMFFSNRNIYSDNIKYSSGVPNVTSNIIVKFEPTEKGADIIRGDNGKILFTIYKEKIKSIEIKKEEKGKKTFLNLYNENEFGEEVISFYADKSNSEQIFTDIKYNLLNFWKLVDENPNAIEDLKIIKEKRDKASNEKAKGCLIAFGVIFGIFLLFWFSGSNKEQKIDETTANFTVEDVDRANAENNKPKTKAEIEGLFSTWDGSLPSLKEQVKDNLQNPDSFEHVDTQYRDDGDGLTVKMKYRGENGFGAIRTQTVTAKVDYGGNILYIESNQ